MTKIPCIKCNEEMWTYIKPYLIEWGYYSHQLFTNNWVQYPLLILIGKQRYNNTVEDNGTIANRELVTDVEEFLERAAALKGFTYKRKDIMEINGIKIKPGMVIITANNIAYIAFPTKEGMAFINTSRGSWYKNTPDNIVKIRDLSEGGRIDNGTILWEKPKEVVITMDQIAEKFGYPIEIIKITK